MTDAKGLITYEVNLVTREVKEADYKPGGIFISSGFYGTETTSTYLLKQNVDPQISELTV